MADVNYKNDDVENNSAAEPSTSDSASHRMQDEVQSLQNLLTNNGTSRPDNSSILPSIQISGMENSGKAEGAASVLANILKNAEHGSKGSNDDNGPIILCPGINPPVLEPGGGKNTEKVNKEDIKDIGSITGKEKEPWGGCDVPRPYPSKSTFDGFSPSNKDAKDPSAEEVAGANEALDKMKGVEELSKDIAEAIVNGKFEDVQKQLQELKDDPQGAEKLQKVAAELSKMLGTDVKAGKDPVTGELKLDILTKHTGATVGGFAGMTPETQNHLAITGSGVSAYQQSHFPQSQYSSPQTKPLDAGAESSRLRAIAVEGVQHYSAWSQRPQSHMQNSIERTGERVIKN